MNNIFENLIATMIAAVLSTLVAFILQSFGFSTQIAVSFALLALVLLFLLIRGFSPICARWITERLLENALNVNPNDTNQVKIAFKKRMVERILRENPPLAQNQSNLIIEYPNQDNCENRIIDAFRNAKKTKILTIRGEKYFLGTRSLFYNLYLSRKQMSNFTVQVLVLAPESEHITEELAEELGQGSAKEIKGKMSIVLDGLKDLASQNKNFKVKRYDEHPNFKILLFDDVMFVSVFTDPKNDHNAKMFQLSRLGNPLFTGLERYFDDLWERAVYPR